MTEKRVNHEKYEQEKCRYTVEVEKCQGNVSFREVNKMGLVNTHGLPDKNVVEESMGCFDESVRILKLWVYQSNFTFTYINFNENPHPRCDLFIVQLITNFTVVVN